jgi:hypothetical protein
MSNATTTKVIYCGEGQGELLCKKCAGVTLQSSINNAKPGQQYFYGLNGERFFIFDEMDGLDCEYGC